MRTSEVLATALAATLAVAVVGCERRTTTSTGPGGETRTTTTVEPSTTAQKAAAKIDDAAITGKIKSAMVAEPGLKAMQVNVDTKDGVVTLTGNVDSQQDIDRAREIAQKTDGVKSVNNQLTVKKG